MQNQGTRLNTTSVSNLPEVLALAAAEQADEEGDDDDSTDHRQGDYQGLEVHYRQRQKHNVMSTASFKIGKKKNQPTVGYKKNCVMLFW